MAFNPSKNEIFEVFLSGGRGLEKRKRAVMDFVQLSLLQASDAYKEKFLDKLRPFLNRLGQRWTQCGMSRSNYLSKYGPSLRGNVLQTSIKPLGRKRKLGALSYWTKMRRINTLKNSASSPELNLAAEMSLRKEGNENGAKLVHEIAISPSRATKIRNAWEASKIAKPILHYDEDDALALFINISITKEQYQVLRNGAKEKNLPNLYPSYHHINNAKTRCYPMQPNSSKPDWSISEKCASVPVQSLLNHTAQRIVLLKDGDISKLSREPRQIHLTLISKWGFDGSSGHSSYKQTSTEDSFSDASILLTSLVPLELSGVHEGTQKTLVWCNETSSSTRFCRPIRFQFEKETDELSFQELNDVENQIQALTPTKAFTSEGVQVLIEHKLVPSMVDGKMCSVLLHVASKARCNACDAVPKEMNNIDALLKRAVNIDAYRFGCSPLHARIRFLENVLHISYRLEIGKWACKTTGEKETMAKKKQAVQDGFRTKMGLLVDQVKQGFGSTNDGNTSRRVFQNVELTAEITGFDKHLLERFSTILDVLASSRPVKIDDYREYCIATARHYVSLYSWYYMPSSVHKILLHSADIMAACLVPSGSLSEEAQECRNKDLRRFREKHSRKCDRVATNEDMLRRLLVTSDPYISSMRTGGHSRVERTPLRPAVRALLKEYDDTDDSD